MNDVQLQHLLQSYPVVPLEKVKSIRLMDRLDTKYLTTYPQMLRLLAELKSDFFAQHIEGQIEAEYRTQYFDTPDFDFYRMHQSGRTVRQKIRKRDYVNSERSFLEVKTKNNKDRTRKERIDCGDCAEFRIANYCDFLRGKCFVKPECLIPTVRNSFKRITLVDRACSVRITLDYDLCFMNGQNQHVTSLQHLCVVELKQQARTRSGIHTVLRDLRIHPGGFSKYCVGMALTGFPVPVHGLKSKLHQIKKINQASV